MVPSYILIKRIVELTLVLIVAAMALLAWTRG
jgi:hypothetical protein